MSIKSFFKSKIPAEAAEEGEGGEGGEGGPRPAKRARLSEDAKPETEAKGTGGKAGAASPAKGKGKGGTAAVSTDKPDPKNATSTPAAPPAGAAGGVLEAAKALPASWGEVLAEELKKPYFAKLDAFVAAQRASGKEVFPPPADVLSAFHFAPFDKITVVVVGQDPYHQPGQAHGLAFSVRNGVAVPPSLVNMYKELTEDPNVEFKRPPHGNLEKWAAQGVFMLNTVLTVRKSEANSHKGQGWETFTDAVIRELNARKKGLIFLLWGKPAEQKCKAVDKKKHHVLTAPHPSPLSASRGWFGCRHFSKVNEILEKAGQKKIDWQN